MARRQKTKAGLDAELDDLPPPARWREWMGRVEAVIFAASQPVPREVLTKLVGRDCNLDMIIEDIRNELHGRPYELVAVAGGFQHRTRPGFADVIHASCAIPQTTVDLSEGEALVLITIAYLQPLTRGELGKVFGKEVSRDTIARLRGNGFIAAGPRSPQPGAPYTYVTTPTFLSHFGFESLRDLPVMEKLEDAGLLSKAALLTDLADILDPSTSEAEAADGEMEADGEKETAEARRMA